MKQFLRKNFTADFSDEEWLEERKQGIGGSDIAALMGVNQYSTPLHVYNSKVGNAEPMKGNIAADMGHYLEDLVAKYYAEATNVQIDEESKANWIAIDKDKPYMRVSPDRLYTDAEGEVCALECKTTSKLFTPDDMPIAWYVQLQYQMHVLGVKKGAVAWIERSFGQFYYREFEYSEKVGQNIEDTCTYFWQNNVLKGVAPAPETADEIKAVFSQSTDTECVADDTISQAYTELKEVIAQIKNLEEQRDERQNQIKLFMENNERLKDAEGNTLCTWKTSKGRSSFDSTAFKKAYPDLYSSFVKVSNGSRTFLVK